MPVREHTNAPIAMAAEGNVRVKSCPPKANVCLSWANDTRNPLPSKRGPVASKCRRSGLPLPKKKLPVTTLEDFENQCP